MVAALFAFEPPLDPAASSSSPMIVSNILNSARSAIVTRESSPSLLEDSLPWPSLSSISALPTMMTRSSAPRAAVCTLTRAPVSSLMRFITHPSFPITRPIRVMGHNNR